MATAYPGQVEDLIEQRLHVPATGQDALNVGALFRRECLELEQLGEAEHGVERRPQFVSKPADEFGSGVAFAFE